MKKTLSLLFVFLFFPFFCFGQELQQAVFQGNLDKVKELLSHEPGLVNAGDEHGRTPLMCAIWSKNLGMAEFLMTKGADPNQLDKEGNGPLHFVVLNKQIGMAELLLGHKAQIRLKNSQGWRPIHLAAMSGCLELAKLFLEQGEGVRCAHEKGDTLTHCAAWGGSAPLMEYFLNKGCPIDPKNAMGRTPMDYAIQAGHEKIIDLLKARGVGPKKKPLKKEIPENAPGENRPIAFTVLYDNYEAAKGAKTDWGFSCLVQCPDACILFDAGGNPEILMHNTRRLNQDLSRIHGIVISHNHWDHIGGLTRVLELNPAPPVYAPVSFPFSFVRSVESKKGRVIAVNEPMEICPHVYTTGEMGNRIKEQSLIINTSQGLVILTGCSHQGVAAIVKKAKRHFNKEILLVFGGFHLMGHSEDQIHQIIRTFKKCNVKNCGATHCTGDKQIELFRQAFKENFIPIGVGRRILVSEKGLETKVLGS